MDSSKYKERVDGIVTNSLVAMAMGVGYRVGLFEAFRDIGQPCTSAQLVNHAHLKERYVQEWLGCMVAGEIIYINDENKYYFPVEVSWMLTQGYMASLLPIFGAKSPELINCMKENGPNGYSYNEYSDFNEWLDQERRNIDGKWIEEHIVPVTKMLKRDCINILDLGCGTGRLAIAVSKYFPNSSIYGIDESQKLITLATCNARNQSCKNVTFLTMEGEHMSTAWTEKFDLVIMLDVLHDLANP